MGSVINPYFFSTALGGGPVSSAGVFDSNGILVRTLWSAIANHANVDNPEAEWDGTLDDLSVAPTGTYTIKVLEHNTNYTWEGVIGNTSPDHSTLYYHNEAGQIQGMGITDAGEMYYTHGFDERWSVAHVTTTADPNTTDILFTNWGFRFTAAVMHAVCTDGTRAYFALAPVGDLTRSEVSIVNCVTHTNVALSPGYAVYTSADGAPANTWNISGIAVQKSGPVLAVARAGKGEIWTVDKTTGATFNKYPALLATPYFVATSPTTGDLWVIYGDRSTATKLTMDSSGVLTTTGVTITGLSDGLALAVSPDGTTLLIVDGGASQQVKAFNTSDGSVKAAFGTGGAFGDAGGYATSPAVTDTKFMFAMTMGFAGGGPQSYIAFQADGSFWLGDPGNCRNLHFSSGNSPTLLQTVSWIPSFYSCRVCMNDPTRVFSGWLEWKIDYSLPLAIGNGSWYLANNWAYGVATTDYDQYNALRWVATLSNGRTYATTIRATNPFPTFVRNVVELRTTGLYDTGFLVAGYTGFDENWNNFFINAAGPGQSGSVQLNPMIGFDGSGTPLWQFFWGPDIQNPLARYITTQVLPATFPTLDDDILGGPNPRQVSSLGNGLWPIYERGTQTGYRLGGIEATTGLVKFSAHPVNPGTFGGHGQKYLFFPEPPFFPIGNSTAGFNHAGFITYLPGATDFFTCCKGEGWGNNQTNVWQHWHESGLMLGTFGVAAPYFAANSVSFPPPYDGLTDPAPAVASTSFKGLAEMSGNSFEGAVVSVGGAYYLYENDEWYHGGMHRWHVDLGTGVSVSNFSVSWDSSNYPVIPADPTDMLAGLPYATSSVPDNTAGWHRNPTTNDTTDGNIGPYRIVSTNFTTCNPHNSPDITFEGILSNPGVATDWTLSRDLAGNGTDWTLSMSVFFLYGLLHALFTQISGLILLDVLDNTGKIIARVYSAYNATPTNSFGVYFNGTPLFTPYALAREQAFRAYVEAKRPLVISGTSGRVDVTYDTHSLTILSPYEVGANILMPTTFRMTYHAGTSSAGVGGPYPRAGVNISEMTFTHG